MVYDGSAYFLANSINVLLPDCVGPSKRILYIGRVSSGGIGVVGFPVRYMLDQLLRRKGYRKDGHVAVLFMPFVMQGVQSWHKSSVGNTVRSLVMVFLSASC